MIRHHRWIAASLVVLSSIQSRPVVAQEAVKVAVSYARTASVVNQLQNDDGGFAVTGHDGALDGGGTAPAWQQ